ncbi:MAG: hypothetical protein GVY26_21800 [Bacteroidetes bacterium]|nr:hypothetical protein [Bacteroidota bacterium]
MTSINFIGSRLPHYLEAGAHLWAWYSAKEGSSSETAYSPNTSGQGATN